MSTAAHDRPGTTTRTASRSRAECPDDDRQPPVIPSGTRGRRMFVVPLGRAVGDADVLRIASVLHLTTHLRPQLRASPASPGVVRLDRCSGLFLLHEPDGEWWLEGRTWGTPAEHTVHGWHVLALDAARLLDFEPSPAALPPMPRRSTAPRQPVLGPRHWSRSRRRITGRGRS